MSRWSLSFLALFALVLAVVLAACASVQTSPEMDLRALARGKSYTLTARSDASEQNAVIHDIAAQSLGALLPIGGSGPVAGDIQVLFSTKVGVTALWASMGFGTAWSPTTATQINEGRTPSGPRTYLNGSMIVVITDAAGKRLWYADCEHKGRYSLAASPQDVARLCMKEISQKLKRELHESGVAMPRGSTP